jgi:ADP-ribose pyrophosphatase YjhB (NUDIX family)
MIECITHYGHKKLLPKDKLTFRPSVYAIIVDNGKVLLLNTRHTGRYSLPGGGIDIGETLEVALKREDREERRYILYRMRFASGFHRCFNSSACQPAAR